MGLKEAAHNGGLLKQGFDNVFIHVVYTYISSVTEEGLLLLACEFVYCDYAVMEPLVCLCISIQAHYDTFPMGARIW